MKLPEHAVTLAVFMTFGTDSRSAQFLLGASLAHFVGWHSGMFAHYGASGSENLPAADHAVNRTRGVG
jgi:hypothetical protein